LRRCLGSSLRRKRDTSPDHPTSNEPITTDSVEPIIRHRPFVRLTSFGGEGRALDRQIATMSSASQEADCALKKLAALYDDAKLRSMIR
jgi:hypothetical protein